MAKTKHEGGPSRRSSPEVLAAMQARRPELENQIRADLERATKSLLARLRSHWGDDPPPRVANNIKRIEEEAKRIPERARALAREWRAEATEALAGQFVEDGKRALAVQIARALTSFELAPSVEEFRARIKEKPDPDRELARARECHERNPDAKLLTLIETWEGLLSRLQENSRLLARSPLLQCHDWAAFMLVNGDPKQRAVAAADLIESHFLSPSVWLEGDPDRRRAERGEIAARVRFEGKDKVRRWLEDVVLPGSLLLAADECLKDKSERVRLGKDWVKDYDGKVESLAPMDLADMELLRWLRQRATRLAGESILDSGDLRQERTSRSSEVEDPPEAGGLGRLEDSGENRPFDLVPRELDPETSAIEHQATQAYKAKLKRLLDHILTFSDDDQKMVALRADGREYKEIASFLGISAAAARKRFERLKTAISAGIKKDAE